MDLVTRRLLSFAGYILLGRSGTKDEVQGQRPDREHDGPRVEGADQRYPARGQRHEVKHCPYHNEYEMA
jgi:hypothetical protein